MNQNKEGIMNWLSKQRKRIYRTQKEFIEALKRRGMEKEANTISVWENHGGLPVSIVGDPQSVEILASTLDMEATEILVKSGHDIRVKLDDIEIPQYKKDLILQIVHLQKKDYKEIEPILDALLSKYNTFENT